MRSAQGRQDRLAALAERACALLDQDGAELHERGVVRWKKRKRFRFFGVGSDPGDVLAQFKKPSEEAVRVQGDNSGIAAGIN